MLTIAFALVFFYAPNDADQGFVQKIFYLHVPIAICALLGFVLAAFHAIRHLRTGDAVHDVRSYVAIHMGVIFGTGALVVVVAVCGCVKLSAIRTAAKFSGTKAPATIAKTDA